MNWGKVFNGTGWLFNLIKNYTFSFMFTSLLHTLRSLDLDISTICHRKMRKIEMNHCLEKSSKTKLVFTHQINQLDQVFSKFSASTANFSHRFASKNVQFIRIYLSDTRFFKSFSLWFLFTFAFSQLFRAHIAMFNNIILSLIVMNEIEIEIDAFSYEEINSHFSGWKSTISLSLLCHGESE